MTTAQNLEEVFGADRSVSFTISKRDNALLFTPMLAEVAGSSLEPSHISTPLRTSLRRTQVVRGKVSEIELESRKIRIAAKAEPRSNWPTIILCSPSAAVSNYLARCRMCSNKLSISKSLLDAPSAFAIMLSTCSNRRTAKPLRELRRELLTFVIAGGGFAGVELAGALNDFSRGILADYPNINPKTCR